MSKGSKRRPTNEKAYADSWERIFGKPEPDIKARKRGGKATQPHTDRKREAKKNGDLKAEVQKHGE